MLHQARLDAPETLHHNSCPEMVFLKVFFNLLNRWKIIIEIFPFRYLIIPSTKSFSKIDKHNWMLYSLSRESLLLYQIQLVILKK
jgi:hypothetical protein